MAFCSQCGAELTTGSNTCPSCGAVIGAPTTATIVNPFDHTAEFDAKDIADNKVYALLAYSLGLVGLVFALIVAKDSEYVKFHSRQCTKLIVADIVVGILTAALCWTCIVPVIGIIIECILLVLHVIAFVQVCQNKAKEPWMIRSISFLN